MARKREEIEVGEYVDALRTWAFVHPRLGDDARAALEAGCAYLEATFDGVMAIDRLCRKLTRWSLDHDGPIMHELRLEISRSSLLGRLIYVGEPLRMQRCPIHDGRWAGRFERCPAGCNFETQITGWLPRLPSDGVPSTAELRDRVLRAGDAAYGMDAPRGARAGMSAAMQAIREQPLHGDPRIWSWRVLLALEAVRARFDDPRDDDGWGVGGVATIRRLVEDARATLVR